MITLQRPKKVEVHAPDSTLADLFDTYLAQPSLKESSRTDVRVTTRFFRRWWQECSDEHHYILSADTFAMYMDWLPENYTTRRNRNYNPQKMLNKTFRLLKRVFRWAHRMGAVDVDLSLIVPGIKRPSYKAFFAEPEDIKSLLANVQSEKHRGRDVAVVAFLAATGCRRQEAANLEARDVHFFENSWFDIDPSHDHSGYALLRITKSGNPRVAVFDRIAGLLIKRWAIVRCKQDQAFFGLGDGMIYRIVITAAAAAGLSELTAHSLRRCFGNIWLNHNKNSGEAADLARRLQMGHVVPTGDVSLRHYTQWQASETRPDRTAAQIVPFYVSPLSVLDDRGEWDWSAVGIE